MRKTYLTTMLILNLTICLTMLACNSDSTSQSKDKVTVSNIDTTKEIYPFVYGVDEGGNRIEYSDDAKKGYKDINNKIVIKPIYQEAGNFSEGLAPVRKGNFWSFIKKDGASIVDFQYDTVLSFSKGVAYVKKSMKWGKIDKEGNVIVSFIYDYPYDFNDGLAPFKSGVKYGFLDSSLNKVLSPVYDNATRFYNGLACVEINNEWKWINRKGETIISVNKFGNDYIPVFNYDKYFGELIIYSEAKNNYLFLSRKGDIINSGIGRIDNYNYYYRKNNFNEGLVPFRNDKLDGFIDTLGNVKVVAKYSQVWSFNEGLAMVKSTDDKCGFIDKTGQLVIPLSFDQATSVNNGLIIAQKGNFWGALNIKGETVIPFIHSQYYPIINQPFYLFQLNDTSVQYNNEGIKLPALYYVGSTAHY